MLAISFAVHFCLALGVALTFGDYHWSLRPIPAESKTSLTLIPTEVSTGLPQAASPNRSAHSVATSPGQIPSPSGMNKRSDSHRTKQESASDSADAVALEANPNANVPQPKIDSLLCPVPPPVLNSKDGVIFVLDVSGSMYEPYAGSTRLALARQALSRQIRALKDGTPFAITVYAQAGRRSGPLVVASDATREAAIRFLMQDFDCGGGTNLPAGLATAQELHAGHIVLASDGDLNASPRDLLTAASRLLGSDEHGLTVIGICPRPNTNDESILQSLAEQQGGNYLEEQANGSGELLTSDKTEASGP